MTLPEKTCPICSRQFVPKFKVTVSCSRKCGRQMAERSIDKIAFGAAISAGKKGKTHLGAPHSEETKKVLSQKAHERMSDPNRNPFAGKKRSLESREKQSRTRTQKILAGEYTGWFDRGSIQTTKAGIVRYKSSWEKRAIERFELDKSVSKFKYEPFAIPYFLNGHKRQYIPDFLIENTEGRSKLIEIKPACFVLAAINLAKFAAARDYCAQNGMTFEVWTEENL